MTYNDKEYNRILQLLLTSPAESKQDTPYELLSANCIFDTKNIISGSSSKYIQQEIAWYESQNRNIHGYDCIEKNPIWQSCSTEDGNINSNYGWCVFSKENNNQYEHCLQHLRKNKYSRQAVIIYTRPNIHIEYCDNIHAKKDMLCTAYTNALIRNDMLNLVINMRSNDVWYGLRYDLAWQQYVLNNLLFDLKSTYPELQPGLIYWHADSLHIYPHELEQAKKWLRNYVTDTLKEKTLDEVLC